MRQSHLIISNAMIIGICRVFLFIPQLILVPYLISNIGEKGYGIYALIWSLLMGIDQLERSLQSGVVKYSAAYLSQGRIDKVNMVISSSFVFSIGLGMIAAVAIVAIALLRPAGGKDLQDSLFIVAGLIFLIIPITPYIGIIQSRQRFYVNVIAETLSKYVSLGLIVTCFAWVTPSVNVLILITASMLLLTRIIQVPIAYSLVPGLRCRFSLFKSDSLRQITGFGFMIVLASSCLVINSTGIRWMMGFLVSPEFVACLAIMLMPKLIISQIVSMLSITVMPAASSYEAQGNNAMLNLLLVRGVRYCVLMIVPILIIAVLLLHPVMFLWVGSKYVFLVPFAFFLMVAQGILLSVSVPHHMLKGLGRLREILKAFVAGHVMLPICLIVVLMYFGVDSYLAVTIGLGLGWTLCAFMQVHFALRTLNIDAKEFVMQAYVPTLADGAIAFALVSVFFYFEKSSILYIRAVIAFCVSTLFLVSFYFFIANKEERNFFRGLFQKLYYKWRFWHKKAAS